MIKTKEDLRYYLSEDLKRQDISRPFLARLSGGENWKTFSCIKTLRHLEYYKNKENKNIFDKFLYVYYLWKHRKNRVKYQFYVDPNVFGPGLNFEHPGFRRISGYNHVGKNCTMLPNILFGKKSPTVDVSVKCNVGDNCYFGYGCVVMQPVNIGNNVPIGAGSIVTKDIPDNAVVAGNPAKIIKMKDGSPIMGGVKNKRILLNIAA